LLAGRHRRQRAAAARLLEGAYREQGRQPPVEAGLLADAIIGMQIGMAMRAIVDPEAVPEGSYARVLGILLENLFTREEAMQQIAPEPVDSVEVTILADNFFDSLLVSEGPASRPSLGPQLLNVSTPFMEGGLAFDQPVVQHGFGRSS
jgi:hypothetical protein